jgi:LuxR family maltose regulon positive regulatory protein
VSDGFDGLLETKLEAPRARPEWVERTGLVARLTALTPRLLLVEAPAGYGKTTLVAQWRLSLAKRRRFAWITLDAGDNDPGRLWWQVAAALQRACPGFSADDVLAAAATQSRDPTRTLLPLLVSELAKLREPVVLVLDDYDLVTEPACHDQLAFLLPHLPQAVQVVLITRGEPPLPLAELRAAGGLAEIRAPDLPFTPAQAAGLVAAVAGVELSEAELADLADRTEGWPAGIYLAALAARGCPSPRGFLAQFSGDSRFVGDFLADDVLSRQPAGVRQFLLRTSILGRFSAPLCDAVTGSSGSAETIDTLAREGLFVVPLDDTRQWFRYHRLFAQMLRGELARTEPETVLVLHERASGWHRRRGSAAEAVRHAQAAGDVAGVVSLIAAHWSAYVDAGQLATVQGWLAWLGAGNIAASPVAAHCAAWAAALSGDRESLRRWLPAVVAGEGQGALPDGIRSLQSSAALLAGTFGFAGIGPMRAAAATAVTLEPDPASPWHALARASYAAALYWSGDLEAAAVQAKEAASGTGAIALIRMLGHALLALIAVDEGNLADAQGGVHAAQEILAGADPSLREVPQSSLTFTAAGALLARRGQLTDARSKLEHALGLRRRQPDISPWPTLEILLRLAPVRHDLGDRPGAIALAAEARQLLLRSPDGGEAQLARLDRVQRRLGGKVRARSRGAPLTEREAAVLALLRGPLSLREIGQELHVSRNTVKTHTQALYRKLGVTNRHEAVTRGRATERR